MPPFPLAARVLEVIADRGEGCTPRYRYGSGCVVAGRTVLTAAHVAAGAVGLLVRGPDKVAHEAAMDPEFTGDADGPAPDLALIEIVDSAVDVPPMGLAAVVRDSPTGDPVERCHVIGYPAFMERETADGGQVRETADALGRVPMLSGLATGLLSVQVSSSPRPLPPGQVGLGDSPWSGMSGGPVVADGLLLGVVTEHAPRAGSSAITATPLTAIEVDPAHPGWGPGVANPRAWWARLGVVDATGLKRLPARRGGPEPAYWATVQEIRHRTGMLTGRKDELAAIGAFAAGDEGYRWLVGEAWAGKTSLLAESVLTLPTDTDAVCYFLSRREADADSSGFLAAVVPQLASLLSEDPPSVGLQHFRDLWRRAAERAGTEGRHLLLVVDGLDEDLRPPGLPSVAALLPATAGGRTHVMVSSRPHPELPADVPAGHPLRHVQQVLVQPFAGAQELEVLARQEIDDLLQRDDGLAADVLGLLTAAAGPLAVQDLAAMTTAAPQSAALIRRIRGLFTSSAARSLQPSGLTGGNRYQFAHESLLGYAQGDDNLNDPDFRRRIDQWAEKWRAADWPVPADHDEGTPLYLLDTYPSTLTHDPQRLAQLASDPGWIDAAVQSVGIDHVLADLRRAAAANPARTVAAMLAAVTGQAYNLRPPQPVDQPGYILRQIWMQAAELAEDDLADDIRTRLHSQLGSCLVPMWTMRRTSRALSGELGRHDDSVLAVAALPDGRVVSVGLDYGVLVWDPADPGADAVELGYQNSGLVAVLADGRVVIGEKSYRMLIYDPRDPGADPIELGRRDELVFAMAVVGLADGHMVTGGYDGRLMIWDPAQPRARRVRLGRHNDWVFAMAAVGLSDGRMVTGGRDGRILVWDPTDPGASPVELGRHRRSARAVAVLANSQVITVGFDNRVLAWDLTSPGTAPVELGRHGGLKAVAVLADGRVITGGNDWRVLVWDLADPGADPVELGRHDGPVNAATVLTDGRVVTGGADGRVLIWDLAHIRADPEKLSDDGPLMAAVLAHGRVITGGDDRRVLMWDPAHPAAGPVGLGRQDGWVNAAGVLADGQVVTGSGNDPRVLMWDPAHPAADPIELGRHDSSPVNAVAGLPDGRVVTGGYDRRVLVWDPVHPRTRRVGLGRHEGMVNAAATLPDGRVVTSDDVGQVLVWDPAHPRGWPVELGHGGSVRAVAGLPDGRVVTGDDVGQVLIWDPAHPRASPVELGHHDGSVKAVVVLVDGRVVTGGADQRVFVWDPACVSTQAIQLSCSVTTLATGSLNPSESNLVIVHQGNGFSLWSFKG